MKSFNSVGMMALAILLLASITSCSSVRFGYVTPAVSERGNHTPISGVLISGARKTKTLNIRAEYQRVADEEEAFLVAAKELLSMGHSFVSVEGGAGWDFAESESLYKVGLRLDTDLYEKWSGSASLSYQQSPGGHNSKTRSRISLQRDLTPRFSLGVGYEQHDSGAGGSEISDFVFGFGEIQF